MKPHWYFITLLECPVCASCNEYRERRYGTKPKDRSERFIYEQIWDYCEL